MKRKLFLLALVVYSGIALLAALAALPFLLAAARRGGWRRLRERYGFVPRGVFRATGPVWFHAVSVGEAAAALPVIPSFVGQGPVAVSTGTATGLAYLRGRLGDAVDLFHLPLDFYPALARLMRVMRPRVLVVVETEIWPGLVAAAALHGVPVCAINARIPPADFARYRATRFIWRHVLGRYGAILAASEADRERFIRCGAAPGTVTVAGNLKYDAALFACRPDAARRVAPLLAGRPAQRLLLVLASSHRGEEVLVLRALAPLAPRIQFVVVPRHPERADRIAPALSRLGLTVALRTACEPLWTRDVVVWNTVGELGALFSFADIVLMGGSWVPHGGHNPIEPAAWARAIVAGPHMENFREVLEALRACGAVLEASADRLADVVAGLAADPARRLEMGSRARACVEARAGAADVCVRTIRRRLSAAEPSAPAPSAGGGATAVLRALRRPRDPVSARTLHRIEYAALLAGVWLARAVPWRHCRRAARLVLPVAWPFLGRYRRTTERNLRLSDLDIPRSGAAFRRLVREVLVQALTTVIEAVKLSRMPREDILRHVVFDAEESWRKVWARSAGGIIAAGHLGNWELLGQAATCMGFPITAVARRQDNPLTDGYLNTARGRWGMRTLFRQDIALARQILDALRGRGIVVFLIDQRGGPKGVPTRFLGRACTTPRGAVQFALRAGVPVCFAYGLRDPDGTHRLFLDEPIEVCDDGRPRDEIERDVTQRLVARLESEVRRHPEQWFWFLDRWRTDQPRPDAAEPHPQGREASRKTTETTGTHRLPPDCRRLFRKTRCLDSVMD